MSLTRMSCVCAALTMAASASGGELALKSGTVEIAQRSPMSAASALKTLSRSAARHAIVQFSAPVEDSSRSKMVSAGVHLQTYLGSNAYIVAVQADAVNAAVLATIPTLIGVEQIEPAWKTHPLLADGAAPDHAIVGVDAHGHDVVAAYVLFHGDVDVNGAGAALAAQHNAVVRDVLESVNGAVIELPLADIAGLAAEDGVQWIEPALPRMSTTNAENRALTQANLAQAAPYNLNGSGVNVLVYDGGTARATHVDFSGRLFVRDGSGQITHATHVAGTVGGDGTANINNRGMAPAVTIQSYGFQHDGTGIFLYSNPGDIETDYGQAINQFGVHIANNSIGSNTETNGFPCSIQGDYGVTDTVIDAIVRGSLSNGQPFRIVWANGNERQGSTCDIEGFGDYYSIAPPAGAKNHITVGATYANDDSMTTFSSWGPTDDGRMKPDISAPGCQVGGDNGVTSCSGSSNTGYTSLCGTSMASPTVTGCCALLLQDFRVQFAGLPDPRNSTLKTILAHTAQDRGNPGPDYQFGYGSVRIKDAIDFMRTGGFVESETSQGGFVDFNVNVPAGTSVFKATLAWDDPPASPMAASALVNDLDVVAIAPGGGTHLAWTLNPLSPGSAAVQTVANRRDNIEQVLVNNPAAGTWTIRVSGFNVPQGPQKFSLCAAGLEPAPGVFISLPNGAPSTLTPGTPVNLPVKIAVFGDTLVASSPTLHVRYDGGPFISIPLQHVSGIDYTATLPPPTCAATPQFYISAEGNTLGEVTNPPNAPASLYEAVVGQTVTLANETFEGAANGWTGGVPGDTATTGVWVQVDPVGTSAQPEDDHTPAPGVKCWVTGQGVVGGGDGANDVDGGFTTLRSPAFDLTSVANPVLSYWRWYDNSSGAGANNDTFVIDISNNDGSTWVNAETIGPSGSDTAGGWIFHQFDVASVIAPTSQMRMRFIAQDLGTASLVEAGLDDFAITSFQCTAVLDDCNANGIVDSDDIASGRSLDANNNGVPDECEGPVCAADITGDQQVNVSDLLAVINAWGPCAGCPADINDDGVVNVTDMLAVINAWGACP